MGGMAQISNNINEVLPVDGASMWFNLHHSSSRLASDLVFADRVHYFRPSVTLIPTLHECLLYTDKTKQYEAYPDYFPFSRILNDEAEAAVVLTDIEYPFISKPSNGSGGSGIRIIHTEDEASKEVESFLSNGTPLLWQEYLPNKFDYRVVVLANRYFWIAKRFIGNRGIVTCTSIGDHGVERYDTPVDELVKVMEYIHEFSNRYNITRLAADVIFDKDNKPVMTEFATSWGGIDMMNGGTWLLRKGSGEYTNTGIGGPQQFGLMAKLLLDGEFKDIADKQVLASKGKD
ncbi:MAG: hypothetical protein GY841_04445 [FCB group bacterium]|nr:hypothetical protein [FCB group bacterium]